MTTREVTLQDINGNYITLTIPESENASFYSMPVASTTATGVVKPDGTTITITDLQNQYRKGSWKRLRRNSQED